MPTAAQFSLKTFKILNFEKKTKTLAMLLSYHLYVNTMFDAEL